VRSLHERPVPGVGGWGILPAVVLHVALFAPALRGLALGAAVLGVVSKIDDRRGLSARVRFSAHVVVVAVALSAADVPWWLAVVAGFAMVWLVNLYNYMDGSNGLAGGMAVFGFGTYAIAAASVQPELAVAGAAAGFLVLNFNPAKIFLGDVGSIPLGFLAGALGFWGWQQGAWPLWFSALAFAPVHRRCNRDASAAPGARREVLAGASRALLSALRADDGQARLCCADLLLADADRRRGRVARATGAHVSPMVCAGALVCGARGGGAAD
jgi:hypothetical protein